MQEAVLLTAWLMLVSCAVAYRILCRLSRGACYVRNNWKVLSALQATGTPVSIPGMAAASKCLQILATFSAEYWTLQSSGLRSLAEKLVANDDSTPALDVPSICFTTNMAAFLFHLELSG